MIFITFFIKSYVTALLVKTLYSNISWIQNLALYIFTVLFNWFFIIILAVSSSFHCSNIIQKVLWWYILDLNGSINFSWNHWWNLLRLINCILIFQLWLGILLWLIHLYFFCNHHHNNQEDHQHLPGTHLLFVWVKPWSP